MATNWKRLQPFYVGVPHRMRPFVRYPGRCDPPENNDVYFEGDSDLSGVYVVDDQQIAEALMDPLDHGRPGGQARHQAAQIAILVRHELESQCVLTPDQEADDDEDDI